MEESYSTQPNYYDFCNIFTEWDLEKNLSNFSEMELEHLEVDLQLYISKRFPRRPLTRQEQIRKDLKYAHKKKILERDMYHCKKCGSHKNLHVDHIVPVSKGGTNSEENLQTLCSSCNGKKGAK